MPAQAGIQTSSSLVPYRVRKRGTIPYNTGFRVALRLHGMTQI
jgi:hypothetical protein